jgi:hypothetical protein
MVKTIKLIDLENLRRRAQEEIAPRPLTTDDIKGRLIKSSFDAYAFTMETDAVGTTQSQDGKY